jgi:hypothetical protein
MNARSLYDVATGNVSKGARTFQPVRRNSYHAGEREKRMWRPINPREIGARMKAAEAFERQQKQAGKRNGPLGHVGLEVLRELYRIVDYKTGRLEPSIDYIMGRIRRSRAAVVRALAALKLNGFLDWIRRTVPTENEGQGPQVRQISNAYCFGLPKAAADIVRRLLGKGPPPDDDVTRRQTAEAEQAAMLASLTPEELARFLHGNSELGDVLARLGRSLQSFDASSLKSQNPAIEG